MNRKTDINFPKSYDEIDFIENLKKNGMKKKIFQQPHQEKEDREQEKEYQKKEDQEKEKFQRKENKYITKILLNLSYPPCTNKLLVFHLT